MRRPAARRRARILGVVLATLAMLAGSVLTGPSSQSATAVDGYDPGMLISDGHFYAAGRMDAAKVQAFLDREGRNCVPAPDGTPCLKDYRADVPKMAATRYCKAVAGGKGWRSSRIIADLSRACGINPEVILVMLQKEQSLVYASGSMLNKTRYDKALGSGCPDFQPCDPKSVGFVMQVYSAGERFQKYRQHPERYNYKVGSNQIKYHPARNCGSATVNIRNQATAALYTYTPFVPNAALIASAGKSSDACSVSGNLTFYRYLKQWFPGSTSGSTAAPIYPSPGSFLVPLTKSYAGDRHDVNRDGVIDLVAERGGRAAYITPTRKITKERIDWYTTVRTGTGWLRVGAIPGGDANRDGRPDLYRRDASGRLYFHPGTASHGLTTPRLVGTGWGQMTWIEGGVDVDGDGRHDILARRHDGALLLYSGRGDGTIRPGRQIGRGWQILRFMTIVPRANGGAPAVVGADYSGRLWSYSIVKGVVQPRKHVGNNWTYLRAIGAGDIDGDGRGDFWAVTDAGALRLYRGTASRYAYAGQFATGWQNLGVVGSQRTGSTNLVWTVDASGVLTRRPFIWSRGGTLTVTNTPVAVSPGSTVIAPGDWNGDGYPDLMWRRKDGVLMLHRGRSDGTINPSGSVVSSGWGQFDQIIAGGDWLGTGRPGLLAFRRSTGTVLFYPSNGGGGYNSPRTLSSRLGWADYIVNAGRWDGDGYPDLIARRSSDGALFLIPGSAGTPMGYQTRRIGSGWRGIRTIVGGADRNGDGKTDLMVIDHAGQVKIYRGTGSGGFAGVSQVGPAPIAGWN
ncbi:FG-GAP repeat domain-containing protein [Enemella sp. A6]|uniref:FG-GAP repeat domain-containing protein n=1 Tax=Enemella sp. A6 TaxID=3440152 RepID=UPI003EBF0E41